MPTAVGKYPPGTEPTQQQALLDAIDAIQQETGVKIPDNMAIDLLEASRTGKASYETLCDYMDKQMSKAVLSQTATTEGTPGKLGDEKTQSQVKQEIVEADADLLDDCLNESLIRWIVDFNFPAVMEYPKIKTRAEEKPDLKKQSEIDKTVTVDIGVPVGKKYFYETYGIPEPDAGEDLVTPAVRTQIGGEFAERKQPEDLSPTNTLNALGDNVLDAADMSDFIAPAKELLNKVDSLEEFRDGLLGLSKKMDEKAMGEFIQRALVLAELSGRFDATER